MAPGEPHKPGRLKGRREKQATKRAQTGDTPEKEAEAKREQRAEQSAEEIKRTMGKGVILT
jgi:hypothetical protein